MSVFRTQTPHIATNDNLRTPQREAYQALSRYSEKAQSQGTREVGIVLPVGCGKSGCITLTPFAFKSKRTLVVAPGINIADQLDKD
ncbi:MAG: DEAD/DEAH box helicase family protein, partial [Candidatus Adiutrix sp.]